MELIIQSNKLNENIDCLIHNDYIVLGILLLILLIIVLLVNHKNRISYNQQINNIEKNMNNIERNMNIMVKTFKELKKID